MIDACYPIPDLPPLHRPPPIQTLLTPTSFLLLSLSPRLFSRLLPGSAPVLGPLLLGLIYGAPLSSILESEVQRAVSIIGYLGLIIILVQGGSETRLDVLSDWRNAGLAAVVGLTRIALPILFSVLVLPAAFGYGRVESFAVGAALSRTCLGTIFAVIQTLEVGNGGTPSSNGDGNSGDDKKEEGKELGREEDASVDLINTRAGTVLIGAALLDDIIGLVLASVFVTLPPDDSSSSSSATSTTVAPWPLAWPIVASVLILALSAFLCRCVLRPFISSTHASLLRSFARVQHLLTERTRTNTWIPLSSDLALLTREQCSGLCDSCRGDQFVGPHRRPLRRRHAAPNKWNPPSALRPFSFPNLNSHPWHPHFVLVSRLLPIQNGLLLPFFFASIGFAIPLAPLLHGRTVWRGIIFAELMGFAKCAAGGWVVLVDWIERRSEGKVQGGQEVAISEAEGGRRPSEVPIDDRIELGHLPTPVEHQQIEAAPTAPSHLQETQTPQATLSWPPALSVGASLISRSEIGYLILILARNVTTATSAGTETKLVNDETFAVGIWATTLNTLVGPLSWV